MDKCAVLNSDYSFINFITWQKAMALILKNKVEVLKHSDDKVVNTAEATFKMPLVIRLMKLVRLVYKTKVPFSKRGVFIRDDFECQYCGKKVHKPTIDHVIPQSKGGPTTWENIVTACKECNTKKRNYSCSQIKMYVKRKPFAPTITEFIQKKFASLGLDKIMAELFSV